MSRIRNDGAAGETIASGMLWIAGVGVALGLLYNLIGLASEPAFGVPWIGVSPSENVYVLETGNPPDPSAGGEVEYTDIDDPMAVFDSGEAADPDLPEIPELPRPIQIQLPVVKSFFDAGAAMIIDARDPEEYAEGHIPGARNLSFDTAVSDPVLLESLDTGGRPIIVYCGGGDCEVSINLAWEILNAGHTRVTYFQGGFPAWQDAGYPVERGEE